MDRFRPSPRQILADVAACIGFYTRLPLPGRIAVSSDFAAAHWAAPVAGILVGAAGAVALQSGLSAGLPAGTAAVAALAVTIVLTGALHEDGAADVADGFGGGRTRERKLEIMRDSRIGTYGVCALALVLMARWSAMAALAATGGWRAALMVVCAHAASRALIPAFMTLVAPARADGASAAAGRPAVRVSLIALGIGGATLLAGGLAFALACALLLATLFVVLRRLCERQIGGQTGDVLGALQQGGEILILTVASALLP